MDWMEEVVLVSRRGVAGGVLHSDGRHKSAVSCLALYAALVGDGCQQHRLRGS